MLKKIVREADAKNTMNVPKIPKSTIVLKLEKKLAAYMLKPEAKTIGGRQKKKKVSSLN